MSTGRFVRTALSVVVAVSTAAPLAAAPPKASDRAAIQSIIADEVAAWNRGDAAGFCAHATDDVAFTNIIGMHSVGRAPFVAQHERIFATIYRGSTLSQSVENVTMPTPDVAIVDTLTEVRGYRSLPPGMAAIDGALRTRLEQVMVRSGGGWRVAAFHNVTVSPAALTPPPAPAPR